MENNVISIHGLCGGYNEVNILKEITLLVGNGGFTAIAGPNGAGKSTLLKYLFRELETNDDVIRILGIDINTLKQKEIAKLISFQGQFGQRTEDFTVREVVAMGRFAYDSTASDKDRINKAMEKAGILHLADKPITQISGGEFQLTMLARTICQDTKILALDEPINNLDPQHQIMLLDMLKDLSDSGKTILCVLHDLNAIMRNCTNVVLLKDGKVFAYGKTKDIMTAQNIKEVYGIDVQIIEYNGRNVIVM